MAEPGQDVAFAATVRSTPVEVAQLIGQSFQSGSGNYFDDTQFTPVGPTTFRVTRKFVPMWAIVVAVIGFLCAMIGLLALLVRDTEVLTIDIQEDPDGCRVTASGKARGDTVLALQSILSRFDGYTPSALVGSPGHAGGALAAAQADVVPMSPDRDYWWDGTEWRPVADCAPPEAQRSEDGRHWFDGRDWRPLADGDT